MIPTPRTADPVELRLARGFRALAVSTWLLLVVGATVRVHGAGLSCPDWPLCFGQAVPRMDFRIFLEWGHRVLAGVETIGLLGLGAMVWARPSTRARAGRLVGIAAVVLVVQIVLGGLTVLNLLIQWSVTAHLLCGNAFLLTLVLLARRLGGTPVREHAGPVALGWIVAGAVLLQVTLGALTSSSEAGLACTEWPTCNGGVWFPTFGGIVGLQLAHRLGAYTVTALVGALAWAMRHDPGRRFAGALVGLVAVQVVLGVTNVLLALPVELAVAHSAVADLLLLTAVVNAIGLAERAPQPLPSPLLLERA